MFKSLGCLFLSLPSHCFHCIVLYLMFVTNLILVIVFPSLPFPSIPFSLLPCSPLFCFLFVAFLVLSLSLFTHLVVILLSRPLSLLPSSSSFFFLLVLVSLCQSSNSFCCCLASLPHHHRLMDMATNATLTARTTSRMLRSLRRSWAVAFASLTFFRTSRTLCGSIDTWHSSISTGMSHGG